MCLASPMNPANGFEVRGGLGFQEVDQRSVLGDQAKVTTSRQDQLCYLSA
jgi:hypothetical protein